MATQKIVVEGEQLWLQQRVECERRFGTWRGKFVVFEPLTQFSKVVSKAPA